MLPPLIYGNNWASLGQLIHTLQKCDPDIMPLVAPVAVKHQIRNNLIHCTLICNTESQTLTRMAMYTTCVTASRNKKVIRLRRWAGFRVPTFAGVLMASGRTTDRKERSWQKDKHYKEWVREPDPRRNLKDWPGRMHSQRMNTEIPIHTPYVQNSRAQPSASKSR
jgi:hypothetical protein